MLIQTLLSRGEFYAVNAMIKVLNVRKFSENELDDLINELLPYVEFLPSLNSLIRLRKNYERIGTGWL